MEPLSPVTEVPAKRRRGVRPRTVIAVIGAIIVISGIATSLSRSSTRLDKSVPGTQQQWIDYLNQSKTAVATINASTSTEADDLSALATLAQSPDPTLNAEIRSAITACTDGAVATCQNSLSAARTAYNHALNEAASEGLVTIEH